MKYILIFIIGITVLSSCITEQKCSNKYPPQIIIKDSIVYTINTIYKDSIINHYIKGDTVYTTKDSLINVYINRNTGIINSDTSKLSNRFGTAYAWVNNSKLKQMLIQNDSVYKFTLDSAIRVTKENYERFNSKVIIKKEWNVHWYDKVARVIAIIFILAILVIVAMKVIKMYIKPF